MTDTLIPRVLWAQRHDTLFLTVEVFEVKDEKIELEADRIVFSGTRGTDGVKFGVNLELYAPIDASASKINVGHREVSLVLKKAEEGPYWPRLLKGTQKMNFIHTDFSKWKDEDEEDEEAGAGEAGFGGFDPRMMSGMGGMPDFSQFGGQEFEGEEGEFEDAEEEEEADFEGEQEEEVKISGLTKDNSGLN